MQDEKVAKPGGNLGLSHRRARRDGSLAHRQYQINREPCKALTRKSNSANTKTYNSANIFWRSIRAGPVWNGK